MQKEWKMENFKGVKRKQKFITALYIAAKECKMENKNKK